jgi:hypothetical protein
LSSTSLRERGGDNVTEKESMAIEHLREFRELLKQPTATGTPHVGFGTWQAVIDAILELVEGK